MCKVRDIILINNYKSEGVNVGKHSFVVVVDEKGEIQGIPYDMVCNVLSSFKDEKQRKKKLAFPGNFPITATDVDVPGGNEKEGYIKADQLYFFDKNNISYKVIGQITEEAFNSLIDFIQTSEFEIVHITDNLAG